MPIYPGQRKKCRKKEYAHWLQVTRSTRCYMHLFKPNGRLLFFVFPVNCIWSFWFSNASYRMIRYSKESLTYQEANIHFNKLLGAWPIWLLENTVSWYNDCFLTASVGFNVITIKSKYSSKMWIKLVLHQKLSKFQCMLACSYHYHTHFLLTLITEGRSQSRRVNGKQR